MESDDDIHLALKKDKCNMGKRYIEVFESKVGAEKIVFDSFLNCFITGIRDGVCYEQQPGK